MRGGGNMNRLFGLCFTSYGSKVGARHKRRVSDIHAVKTFLFCFSIFVFFAFFQVLKIEFFFPFYWGGIQKKEKENLSGGELSHRLGAFRHGVLGQFTRQDQSNGRLDFSGRHGRLLVVSGQLGGFRRDLFEDVDLVGFDLLLGGLLGAAFDGLLRWFLAGHCVSSSFVCV
jgi:hypothetical protein